MKVELPLEQMTVAEKLNMMEVLWTDLSQKHPDEIVPDWHGDELRRRERQLSAGEEN